MIDQKIRVLLKKKGLSPTQLRMITGLSRSTISRLMAGHIPSDKNLSLIADALDISPGYLRGNYKIPDWLSEEDVLFLSNRKNSLYLHLIRESVGRGLTLGDFEKLIQIIINTPL